MHHRGWAPLHQLAAKSAARPAMEIRRIQPTDWCTTCGDHKHGISNALCRCMVLSTCLHVWRTHAHPRMLQLATQPNYTPGQDHSLYCVDSIGDLLCCRCYGAHAQLVSCLQNSAVALADLDTIDEGAIRAAVCDQPLALNDRIRNARGAGAYVTSM